MLSQRNREDDGRSDSDGKDVDDGDGRLAYIYEDTVASGYDMSAITSAKDGSMLPPPTGDFPRGESAPAAVAPAVAAGAVDSAEWSSAPVRAPCERSLSVDPESWKPFAQIRSPSILADHPSSKDRSAKTDAERVVDDHQSALNVTQGPIDSNLAYGGSSTHGKDAQTHGSSPMHTSLRWANGGHQNDKFAGDEERGSMRCPPRPRLPWKKIFKKSICVFTIVAALAALAALLGLQDFWTAALVIAITVLVAAVLMAAAARAACPCGSTDCNCDCAMC